MTRVSSVFKISQSLIIVLYLINCYNQLNSVTINRLNWRGNAQHKQQKSCTMLYNPKNCGIMGKCSINRTSLIEQYWIKSRDEAMYRKIMEKRNV